MADHADTRLTDRHVVVTGGAQGIGRGIAVRCARAGADVSVFDTDTETATTTVEEVEDEGVRAAVYEVDVTDETAVLRAVEGAQADHGPIHGLVNNAGVQQSIPILETAVEDWEAHFAVNARGTFLCAKHVTESMIADGISGSIINIASVGAERPFRGQGAYGASKAAVEAFTTVLAKELSDHDITANSIKPGTVETPMVEKWVAEKAAVEGVTSRDVREEALEEHVLDRVGQPEEIGHVVVLLLSDEGNWMTGESVAVDGGYLAR